ncbi:arginase [Achlya hypogyna]|uniref:Arginase n=1 Tax=Achlya hypogyna TaxID=1202772 RepID=A0A1V9Z1H4_ACHHY|nr:arginase [Achlya hypogyna]
MLVGCRLGRRAVHGLRFPLVPFVHDAAAIDAQLSSPSGVALFGVPIDSNSSFLRGPADAPDAIRHAFLSDSANGTSELGVDVGMLVKTHLVDLGNVSPSFDLVTTVAAAAAARHKLLVLGGDHSITFPVVRGLRSALLAAGESRLNILHLDAHSDMYADDVLGGDNALSHASPFARILEHGLCMRLVQVGIRTQTAHLWAQADKYNVEVHDMVALARQGLPTLKFDGPLYISIDLDVLDPAFAPGVSHYEPGGMTTRDVLTLLQSVEGPIVGADIVELNVARDIGAGHAAVTGQTSPGMTAMVAAKFAKELLARMVA